MLKLRCVSFITLLPAGVRRYYLRHQTDKASYCIWSSKQITPNAPNGTWKSLRVNYNPILFNCLRKSKSFFFSFFFYPHLMVDPVQEVGDVAVNSWFVVLRAAPPPDTVSYEPPGSVLQGHQRAAAVRLIDARLYEPHACNGRHKLKVFRGCVRAPNKS